MGNVLPMRAGAFASLVDLGAADDDDGEAAVLDVAVGFNDADCLLLVAVATGLAAGVGAAAALGTADLVAEGEELDAGLGGMLGLGE